MNNTRRAALGLIFLAGSAIPAMAQDAFPDTPANHWAYDALNTMKKDGLLVGYPDGLFRGSRPASRYELAVATQAVYLHLRGNLDSLASQIQSLKNAPEKTEDLDALRTAIGEVKNGIVSIQAYKTDITNLQHLTDKFELELNQLGVDVEKMRKDLGDLSARVTALENKKPPVDIKGDLNIWLGGGNGRSDLYGLNKDGRVTGISTGSAPVSTVFGPVDAPAGINRDLTILHEAAFTFSGTNDTGPKWHATLVVTDMFGQADAAHLPGGQNAFGNQSSVLNPFQAFALEGYETGPSDLYFQDFAVQMKGRLGGAPVDTEVGRIGYKISPYIFQRLDNTSYFSNDRWDDGQYRFDGASTATKIGSAKVSLFGGKASGVVTTKGVAINPLSSGPIGGPFGTNGGTTLTSDRLYGAQVNLPIKDKGAVNLAYLWLDSDTPAVVNSNNYNRLNVYGGDANYSLGRVKVEGGYSKSPLYFDGAKASDDSDAAWNLKLAYTARRFGIYAGYREVDGNYLAPGDWGRLGVLRNPTNIKGTQVGAYVDITPKARLSASGEFIKGKDDAFGGSTYLTSDTKIEKYAINLTYKLSRSLDFLFGYEDTKFRDMVDPATSFGDPRYRWTTFGLGYGLNSSVRWSLQYELSDVDNDYQVTSAGGNSTFKGGFLTSQLTVKF